MARSIATIQSGLIATIQSVPVLAASFTSTSITAVWLLITYVWAVGANALESLWDAHLAEVQSIIANQKAGSLLWYGNMAKAFQYGIALPADTDTYAVVPPVNPDVLIVAESVAVGYSNYIRIKVAQLVGGVLTSLSGPQLAAFTAYMEIVKYAGDRLVCTSGVADNLQLGITIYYDPLQLTDTGSRIDGTEDTPVLDGINAFLDNIPFNGVLIYNDLITAMQAISGVVIGQINTAQANYAATAYVNINPFYVPDAGYLALDGAYFNANITYLPYSN